VRNVALRGIRKLLRNIDAALDPPHRIGVAQLPPPTNRREAEIEEFLSSIDIAEPGMAAYLREHKQRLIRTLSVLPLGNDQSHALELGSYLHMAAALERVLGYGSVRAAYYSPSIGRHRKSVAIRGQAVFTTDIDLFDAERDTYPYPDSVFDLVLCCELIEHLIHDPMHMLIESWRVLKDGGFFVLTTPNVSSLSSVGAALRGEHNPQVFSRYPTPGNCDTPHVREYTPSEIATTLGSVGFEATRLFTERLPGAQDATWVLDILQANGFNASLRGEQIYCVARKRSRATVDRYPQFLYSR
jgi:SAM-dependent methyltransferase